MIFVVQKMDLLLVARQNRRNSNADISKDLASKFEFHILRGIPYPYQVGSCVE